MRVPTNRLVLQVCACTPCACVHVCKPYKYTHAHTRRVASAAQHACAERSRFVSGAGESFVAVVGIVVAVAFAGVLVVVVVVVAFRMRTRIQHMPNVYVCVWHGDEGDERSGFGSAGRSAADPRHCRAHSVDFEPVEWGLKGTHTTGVDS